MFAEDQPSRLLFLWGHAHYVKGVEDRWCRHNLPYTGQSLVSNLIHKLRKILAHNTSLVTSGNSRLPRPNSSRKSSDIPLPTQSPIWVNPMRPIILNFGKKCYSVTTPGDNLQISSTKRAFIECMFLPHRLRSFHQGYFPDLIDCRPVFLSTKFVLSRVTVGNLMG